MFTNVCHFWRKTGFYFTYFFVWNGEEGRNNILQISINFEFCPKKYLIAKAEFVTAQDKHSKVIVLYVLIDRIPQDFEVWKV